MSLAKSFSDSSIIDSANSGVHLVCNYGLYGNCSSENISDHDLNISYSNATNDSSNLNNYGAERIIVPLVFSIVILFGFLGNTVVIIVVVRNKDHFRNTTNLFILNLSIADLLFLLFCVPFHAIIYTVSIWPFGLFMCKFVHLIQYSSMVASVLTLVAMAADRYMAVAHALETKHLRTPTVALVISCIIWLVALSIASPSPFAYTERFYQGIGIVCSHNWDANYKRQTYFLLLFILGYMMPLIAIFILSSLIIRQLWLTKQPEGPRMKESISRKRKVTRLIIVVVLVFSLCWLPMHVIWIWTNFFVSSWKDTYPFYYFRIVAHVLSYGNSAINPVIYAFLSANFRRGFQRAVLGRNVHPSPVQRFTFTKSSHSNGTHFNQNNGFKNTTSLNQNGYGNNNEVYNNRYCMINLPVPSYSDTCV